MRKFGGEFFRLALVCGLTGTFIAGCAINPTPYSTNLGSVDHTVAIIRHVRCEARDAMVRQAVRLITGFATNRNTADPHALAIARALDENPGKVRTDYKSWDIHPLAVVQGGLFLSSGFGLRFVLEGKENNSATLNPALNPTTGSPVFKITGLNAGKELTRRNERTIENVESQFASYQNIRCPQDEVGNPSIRKHLGGSEERVDWIYPMRGNIQLSTTIAAYVDYAIAETSEEDRFQWAYDSLNSTVSVASDHRWNSVSEVVGAMHRLRSCGSDCETEKRCYDAIMKRAQSAYIKTFYGRSNLSDKSLNLTDELQFTTKLSTGLNPALEFASATGGLNFKSVGLDLSGYRQDTHTLTVAIEGPPEPATEKKTKKVSLGSGHGAKVYVELPGDDEKPKAAKACLRKERVAGRRPTRLLPAVDQTQAEKAAQEENLRRMLNQPSLLRIERRLRELED